MRNAKKKSGIDNISPDIVHKVKAQFLRYTLYKQISEELDDLRDDLRYDELLSYRSASDIENSRVTSSRSLVGQPEKDALKILEMSEDRNRRGQAQAEAAEYEKALSTAIIDASKEARLKSRDFLQVALYDILCLNIPISMIKPKMSMPTLSYYRDLAIVNAAANLGYIEKK